MMPIVLQTADEFEPVVGATARLLDPDTMEIIAETTSGEDGLVDFGEVFEGSYILQITGEGFEDYSEPIELIGELEFELVLTPTDVIDPTIPDDDDHDDDGGSNPGTGNPGGSDDDNPADPGGSGGQDDDNPTNPGGSGEPDDNNPANPGRPGESDGGADNPGGTGGSDDDDLVNPGGQEGSSNSGDGSEPGQTGGDSSDAVGSAHDDLVASTGSSAGTTSGSVNQLPATGVGESQTNVVITVTMLLAGISLLGAAAIRRRASGIASTLAGSLPPIHKITVFLDGSVPAIDADDGTGDERGLIASEEGCGVCHALWGHDTA